MARRGCVSAAGKGAGVRAWRRSREAAPEQSMAIVSSGRRYREYRQQIRDRRRESNKPPTSESGTPPRRERSFGRLLREFLQLLKGHRGAIGFALATLTVATVLRLAPP